MTVKKIKTTLLAIALLILTITLTGLLSACSFGDLGSSLVINEVVSSNTNSLSLPQLGSPDWVEIYNASSNDIDIES